LHSLDRPRKDAIDAHQEQIEVHLEVINRLNLAQNSHVPVSSLAAELLAEVFLHIVESNLLDDVMGFATGTFSFRLACRRWNEVAITVPWLWAWWTSGAARALPLFNVRLKGAPLSLTWRPLSHSTIPDTLMDPTVPGRIHQLGFSGGSE